MHRLWPLLLLLACGKSDTGIRNFEPAISLTPLSLDYGQVIEEQSVNELLFLSNEGRADLEVELTLTGPDAAVFSMAMEGMVTIPPNEEIPLTIPVTFTPAGVASYSAQITAESNDEETPLITVDLVGEGIPTPVPDICLNTAELTWTGVIVGSSNLQILSIENCGDADLELGSISQTGAGAFRIDGGSDPSHATIAPGENQAVLVFYEPTHDLGDNGTLTIPTLNDPDEPEVVVSFTGNGGGNVVYPVAVIDCPGQIAPPVDVVFDGTGSYDPNALEPLLYYWTLVTKPPGSQSTLTTLVGDTTQMFADVGGDYEVTLQVENTDGVLGAPERCAVSSAPPDDLWVELTWDVAAADLDLHLLQNDQTELFSVPGDCTWCNGAPSWSGGSADPVLVQDSRSLGPESIGVPSPAAGTYPVAVHYYDPFGGASTNATVRVFAYGVEVFSDTQTLARNEVWNVGQVNWPAGTFGVYPVTLAPAANRQCF